MFKWLLCTGLCFKKQLKVIQFNYTLHILTSTAHVNFLFSLVRAHFGNMAEKLTYPSLAGINDDHWSTHARNALSK